MSAAQRRQILAAKLTNTSVAGNAATVTVSGSGDRVTLSRVGGRWLIDGGVGF
jgi:hypothetical protein